MRLTVLSKCLLVLTIAIYVLWAVPVSPAEREHINREPVRSEYYVTQPGDTLESIAVKFIGRNSYGERRLNEFAEGIAESNAQYFMSKSKTVPVGVKLKINYWEAKEQ